MSRDLVNPRTQIERALDLEVLVDQRSQTDHQKGVGDRDSDVLAPPLGAS